MSEPATPQDSKSYNAIVQRTVERHVLFSVLLELTFRCNLDCFFCYNDLNLRGKFLSEEQYFRLLEDLKDMQVLQITFSGGEPLSSPVFWTLGRRARQLGFVTRIKSNGHALSGPVARRMVDEIDPYVVEVSLHGASAETHDRQTRIPGSFERLLTHLEQMRAAGLRVKLNSTLTRWNEDEVEAMFGLADTMGIPLSMDPTVTPRDDGDREPLAIAASGEGVRRLFQLLRRRSGASPAAMRHHDDGTPARLRKNCGTGAATLAVDPFGNVYPCVQWRRPLGSLHRQSVKEIWAGSEALLEVRAMNAEAGRRVSALGREGRNIGFCLGLAEQLTGDPLGLYDQAERHLRILGTLDAEGTIPLPIHGQTAER